MIYDEHKLSELEGEARAAAFRLGKVLAPVQARLEAEQEAFDILTATQEDCERRHEIEVLLSVMQTYCESTAAYSEQLTVNLIATTQAMQAEATRAAFHLRQFTLAQQELTAEKALTSKWWNACQVLLKTAK
jgi:hypothetical protein